jgi:hypothetical protein
MARAHSVLLHVPLAVGFAALIGTILVHALPLSATIAFVRREENRGRMGTKFWRDTWLVMRTILSAFLAHLIAIALWAGVFVLCGQFSDFDAAYYQSAGNYTSLGSGDILMSPAWRLLAPLETADGVLMFGVSAAMIFAVIQRLVQARYAVMKS